MYIILIEFIYKKKANINCLLFPYLNDDIHRYTVYVFVCFDLEISNYKK